VPLGAGNPLLALAGQGVGALSDVLPLSLVLTSSAVAGLSLPFRFSAALGGSASDLEPIAGV